MDCVVFLLHRYLGPQWIYFKLFWIGGYVLRILEVMARHPYLSAMITVILFALTIIVSIVRWWVRRTMKHQIDQIEKCVVHTKQNVDRVKVCVEDMSKRIRVMEEKHDEILKILKMVQTTQNHRT